MYRTVRKMRWELAQLPLDKSVPVQVKFQGLPVHAVIASCLYSQHWQLSGLAMATEQNRD